MKLQNMSNNPTPLSRTLDSADRVSRTFAKLALAGAVALALQSAYAENITVNEDQTYTTDIVGQDAYTSLTNSGTITNNEISINGGTFDNTGTIETGTLNLKTPVNGAVIGGSITANEEFVFQGVSVNLNFARASSILTKRLFL